MLPATRWTPPTLGKQEDSLKVGSKPLGHLQDARPRSQGLTGLGRACVRQRASGEGA